MLDGEVPRRLLNHTGRGRDRETETERERGVGVGCRICHIIPQNVKHGASTWPNNPLQSTNYEQQNYVSSKTCMLIAMLFIVGRATPSSSCSWMDIYMVFIYDMVYIAIGYYSVMTVIMALLCVLTWVKLGRTGLSGCSQSPTALHFILYRTCI